VLISPGQTVNILVARFTSCSTGTLDLVSTPSEVMEIIDTRADDIYDAYYDVERSGPPYDRERLIAAGYLALRLLRGGWRRQHASSLPLRDGDLLRPCAARTF
jgi:hypothetical protein